MAEPTGWSWLNTRILGNQVIVYDRGVSYGEYKYNIFSQSLIKTSGTEYDPVDSPDSWRFLIAYDGSIEYSSSALSVEKTYDSSNAERGYFTSAHLPWSITPETYGTTGTSIGTGYSNTTLALDKVIYGDEIWSLTSYWREFHNASWFVPSIGEINQMYLQKLYLPGLTASLTQLSDVENLSQGICRLWSSTESTTDPTNFAQIINWRDGEISDYQKDLTSARFTLCRYE